MNGSIGPQGAGEEAKEPPLREALEGLEGHGGEGDDDGLTIPAYAQEHRLSETEVWRQLRRGELVGRSAGGQLLIYQGTSAMAALAELPPLPDEVRSGRDLGARAGAANEGAAFLSLSGDRGQAPELALLLDHLSLAKEENREILRMTQDSIRQIAQMSTQIAQMKDEVIAAKNTELTLLQEQLAARDLEIRRLKQHSEDLEMLARSMAAPRHA